ncbi:hypothetical protein ACFO25_19555 [Paenactinomyces guangxiensis]|uniref:Uncharacterized protein n=1 Tax=Paenactinomyces guangxiensis TaxID=1490290 RepID=A0A7W2AA79_9BACL|nr:hypothetical protein [Paenactinomyces guangxiensis]MBA4496520.1 hypothetical protein [Paenactinomyces guangxiensis]MBH8593554.1 hypothetical protein [Paenactinomyces guangxiensis]
MIHPIEKARELIRNWERAENQIEDLEQIDGQVLDLSEPIELIPVPEPKKQQPKFEDYDDYLRIYENGQLVKQIKDPDWTEAE